MHIEKYPISNVNETLAFGMFVKEEEERYKEKMICLSDEERDRQTRVPKRRFICFGRMKSEKRFIYFEGC